MARASSIAVNFLAFTYKPPSDLPIGSFLLCFSLQLRLTLAASFHREAVASAANAAAAALLLQSAGAAVPVALLRWIRSLSPDTNTVPVQLPPRIAPRLSAVGGSAGLAGVLAYSAHGISLSVLGIQLSAANPAI